MEYDHFKVDDRGVVHERYDNEIIAINLNTGIYYSLNSTAAEIFEMVARDSSVMDVVAVLGEKYSEGAGRLEQEIRRFLAELCKETLIQPVAGNGAKPRSRPSQDQPRRAFVLPRVDKHSDMQELFLLDPIHETGKDGWPQQRDPKQ